MSITAYNETYRDDLNVLDANGNSPVDKNYMRILFKPGVAVQTRELNQLQSMLQVQLDRLGTAIFKSGRAVINGRAGFDDSRDLYSIDVYHNSIPRISDDVLALLKNVTTSGGHQYSLVTATKYLGVDAENGFHIYRFYIKNIQSETNEDDENVNSFSVGDNLTFYTDTETTEDGFEVYDVGRAVGAKIESGIYFIRGNFVYVEEQYITHDLPDDESRFNGSIVLGVRERIVQGGNAQGQDPTLLDNAQGTPNFAAPGADRYSIETYLDFLVGGETGAAYDTTVSLMSIKNDAIEVDITLETTAGIDDKLAQRTYEESGNYEVNPFAIHVREAYRDELNGGLYRSKSELRGAGYGTGEDGDLTNAIEEAKGELIAQLAPSVAYVDGYRIESYDTVNLRIPKARDQGDLTNVNLSANIGNYVEGNYEADSGIPNVSNTITRYELYDSDQDPNLIGTVGIKSTENLSSGRTRLFLYDVRMGEKTDGVLYSFSEAVKITGPDVGGFGVVKFEIKSVRFAIDDEAPIFILPRDVVSNVSSVSFTHRKSITAVADEPGTVTISFGAPVVKNTLNIDVYNITTNNIISNFTLDASAPNDLKIMSNNIDDIGGDGDSITVVASVTEPATPGSKSLINETRELPSQDSNGEYILTNVYHLYELRGESANQFDIVNNGEGKSTYTEARVKLKSDVSPPPADISIAYFQFSAAGDYFVVQNYRDLRPGFAKELEYEDFPISTFIDDPLYNVIDFRSYPGGPTKQIAPWSVVSFDMTYYLARTDTITLNALGEFGVKRGISDDEPRASRISRDSMAIYNVDLNAYTFDTDDIIITKIDNRRYTMRNIRALERRIGNLERYTTLSLLEREVSDTQLFGEDGIDRFKNGFVVDNFVGHQVGDPSFPGYACAVDPANNTLRPAFTIRSLKLEDVDTTEIAGGGGRRSGVHDKCYILPYDEVSHISQSVATSSISVNPYEFGTVVGTVELYPASDHWVDVNQAPDVLVKDTAAYDAFRTVVTQPGMDVLGTEWSSWEKYWEGEKQVTLLRTRKRLFRRRRYFYDITQDIGEAREGIETTLNQKWEEKSLGDRVLSIAILPYIRSRYVYFQARGLKPNTVYYSFFDGVRVSDFTYALSKDSFLANKTNDIASIGGGRIPQLSDFVQDFTKTLKTDDTGTLYGVFVIPPASDGIRFPVGNKKFRLTDSRRNDDVETRTYADATYSAIGSLEERENTIISTAIPELIKSQVRDTRVTTQKTTIKRKRKCQWGDPVAQSMLITNPEGIFATSIDLFFRTKAEDRTADGGITAPVEVYIVPTENGIPTQKIVPFTHVLLDTEDVNVDTGDGTTPTRFTFDQPVYLQPGQEYAIVATSTDSAYSVYISRVGETDLVTGESLTQNPYMGVFFTSQNSSTWTPEQYMDLKFTLNRARFDISRPRTVYFESKINSQIESVEVTDPGGPYSSAPTVTIVDGGARVVAAARAVLDAESSGIARIDIIPTTGDPDDLADANRLYLGGDGYTSTPTVVIGEDGLSEGGTPAVAVAQVSDFPVSNFYLKQDSVLINATDESETRFIAESDIQNRITILGETYEIDAEETHSAAKTKRSWSANGITANNPVQLDSTLDSTSDFISPIIDRERHSVKIIRNFIREEGQASSKYVTRDIKLAGAADRLDVYFDINRPSADVSCEVYAQFVFEASPESSAVTTDFILMNREYPSDIPVNADPRVYTEMHYNIDPPQDFEEFRVMITFEGSNIVDAPTIKRLRAIATV